jgi:Na+-transporting NADH:ubiquinone oxidoreductase subunit C
VGINSTVENAEELYNQYITGDYIINPMGETLPGKGFDVKLKPEVNLMFSIKKLRSQLKNLSGTSKSETENKIDDLTSRRQLPIFRCNIDNQDLLIIPVMGKGLWGPIWGYISIESDYNTIYGVIFDHKGETPGLGADINASWFEEPFKGKKLFDAKGEFIGINVYKGGKGAAELAGDADHGVDAISGGTITSVGLQDMIKDCLEAYAPYFKSRQKEALQPETVPEESLTTGDETE